MTTIATTTVRPIPVRLAYDYDPDVLAVPGMDLGLVDLREDPEEAAIRWFHEGIRKVTLPGLVDLAAAGRDGDPQLRADMVRRLVLVRELTGHGVAVEWRLRLGRNADEHWSALRHLQPPTELLMPDEVSTDPAQALSEWRSGFYLDMCTYRLGPGFVQIRDRRTGKLNLITIDDADYLAVMRTLDTGAELRGPSLDIAREFAAEGLVMNVGTTLVWLPYRLRRWPLPSLVV